ncbi:DUF2927 domain-containing protein, partial [Oceanicella sp. SM1341]|uniref:DUF2927 domain-containing protein n=1 Tax=Oceanicella sp. SM1341 TaxID=1548889 RepID=UPI000E506826
ATGRAITVTAARDAPGPPAPGTLQVRFADAPARRALADRLAPRLGEGGRLVPALRADPPPSPCLFWPVLTGEGRISAALVVIAAETAGLVRLACIHEEVTQALGLFNDGPGVRPSLFNDDQEFALLTRHDAALLAMLYDTHLHPGQPASAVRPFLPAAADRALASGAAAIPSAD